MTAVLVGTPDPTPRPAPTVTVSSSGSPWVSVVWTATDREAGATS